MSKWANCNTISRLKDTFYYENCWFRTLQSSVKWDPERSLHLTLAYVILKIQKTAQNLCIQHMNTKCNSWIYGHWPKSQWLYTSVVVYTYYRDKWHVQQTQLLKSPLCYNGHACSSLNITRVIRKGSQKSLLLFIKKKSQKFLNHVEEIHTGSFTLIFRDNYDVSHPEHLKDKQCLWASVPYDIGNRDA